MLGLLEFECPSAALDERMAQYLAISGAVLSLATNGAVATAKG